MPEPVFNLVSTDYYQFRDGCNFFIQGNFKPEEKENALKQIKEQINDICLNGVMEKELNKAKKKLKAGFAENSETVSDIAETIGFYMTVCDDLKCVEEYINVVDKITLDDVKSAAQEYLDLNKAVIAALMPETYKNQRI